MTAQSTEHAVVTQRFGFDALPLYQHHCPDVKVPFEESMGAMHRLVDDGVVVRVGVSNVDSVQLGVVMRGVGGVLAGVQSEYSLVLGGDDLLLLDGQPGEGQ